jgi:hypothetical protein
MKYKIFIFFIVQALLAPDGFGQNINFNKKVFDEWVKMRIGSGEQVFWYCFGEVYSYPEGKLLAKMEGTDVARMIKVTADSVIQLNRKIFAFEDPITGIPMKEINGQKVDHIAYPYQYISYVNKGNGKLTTWVEQGKAPRITKLGPGTNTTARMIDGNIIFSSPVFLNFTTPQGKYEAYENYDFHIVTNEKKVNKKYQLYWNRFGDLPPFLGGGKGIIQLVCYRIDDFKKLPTNWQRFLKEEFPLWMNAPKDLKEIETLQKQ